MDKVFKGLWRIAVAAGGTAVFAAGTMMLVLPGPGLVVMFLGLAILSTEFKFARDILKRVTEGFRGIRDRTRVFGTQDKE